MANNGNLLSVDINPFTGSFWGNINTPSHEEFVLYFGKEPYNWAAQQGYAYKVCADMNREVYYILEKDMYGKIYLAVYNTDDPLNIPPLKDTSAPHIKRLRKYNPYQLPDIDISGPGYERERISLLKANRPNVFEFKGETNAILQVMDRDGNIRFPTRIQDIKNPYETWYYNFFLTGVSEQRQEIAQISRLFGNALEIQLFGSNPIMLICSGYLLNTEHYRWADDWIQAYETYLKGTKCIENNARIYLAYEDNVVNGYMLSTTPIRNANMPLAVAFQFTFLVIDSISVKIPSVTEIPFSAAEGGHVYDLEVKE